MTSSETSARQRECVVCGQPTNYPIELNERFYCSSTCVGKYREEVGHQQFQKDSIATFEKKRETGWIPERALMYINMCRRCHKKMVNMCKGNQYVSGMHREELRQSETTPWCCHARFNLSSSLSDGTVPLEAARKIQAMAEEMVRNPEKCEEIVGPEALRKKMSKQGGLEGVTTTMLDIAAAEMVKNPDYKPTQDKTPKVEGEIMVHYAACLECDPVFAAECEEQAVEKELNKCVEEVQEMTKGRWCEHTLHALSALLLNKNMSREKLQQTIDSAERIVKERGDFGVTARDLFIAMGRAVEL